MLSITQARLNSVLMGRLRRPPSYSDSFFFMPDDGDAPPSPLVVYTPAPKKNIRIKIAKRAISFLFHILLISIFETLFFFLFISKSEDEGIQNTIGGYVEGVVSQCSAWSKNESAAVSEILALFLNASDILSAAYQSGEQRLFYNLMLNVPWEDCDKVWFVNNKSFFGNNWNATTRHKFILFMWATVNHVTNQVVFHSGEIQ